MRMFNVPAGTPACAIQDGKEWTGGNFIETTTKNDNLFALEEVAIDPLGKQGPDPHGVTVGGYWAKLGYYGFKRDGWTLLVPGASVEVM